MIQKLDRITRIDYNGIWNRVFPIFFLSICLSCIFTSIYVTLCVIHQYFHSKIFIPFLNKWQV